MNAIQCAVLKTLIYFDMFDHPLQLDEIHRFLPSDLATREEVHLNCFLMLLGRRLEEKDGYFALAGRAARLAELRVEKEGNARRMWRVARLITWVVRRFPFVRGVFVSGELSKGVASKGSDIDFFIVTAERRVWIVRTICTAFKVIFLLNRRKFFCYNHIVSEDSLEVEEKNLYTAVESVTVKPIFNEALFERFCAANAWTAAYLPHAAVPVVVGASGGVAVPFAERVLNVVLPSKNLDRIEDLLLRQWRNIWSRRYTELSEEKRDRLFRCTPQLSTAYARDFLERIMLQYNRRLSQFGLSIQPQLPFPEMKRS